MKQYSFSLVIRDTRVAARCNDNGFDACVVPARLEALGIKRSTSFIANDAWIYDIVTVSATGAKPVAAAATNYNVVCT